MKIRKDVQHNCRLISLNISGDLLFASLLRFPCSTREAGGYPYIFLSSVADNNNNEKNNSICSLLTIERDKSRTFEKDDPLSRALI